MDELPIIPGSLVKLEGDVGFSLSRVRLESPVAYGAPIRTCDVALVLGTVHGHFSRQVLLLWCGDGMSIGWFSEVLLERL